MLLPQDQSKEDTDPDVAWDVEHIASDEDGLVIFDGGTYSRGPAAVFDGDNDPSSGDDEALEADKERLERQLSLEVSSQLTLPRNGPLVPKRARPRLENRTFSRATHPGHHTTLCVLRPS